ncbi:hypothetical protein ENUP19_0100G0008 [Entamoeba nuttalli]|uniref:GTPase-activator protein for Ras family GTPase n=2 Tax=Entamoeba nuttalli TaxID=412467 RepID=K2HH04_ENTNP|nr:GTPase-activator protein for Ras family GTPase [Entamoeba nuttalli P19]EKE42174.1 GTPase-activator protein for Ras family GTPase [Entamoeba nuttalli P19]|eukprot:XP_008855489.1 GTPase-activator protein for Ras family GTPase [Entamoeba nuttalli P19]
MSTHSSRIGIRNIEDHSPLLKMELVLSPIELSPFHFLSKSCNSSLTHINSSPLSSPVLSKHGKEDYIKELFLQPNSPLLYAYCQSLIQQSSNPTYSKVLLSYFFYRGKIVDLLFKLASTEIENSFSSNELFRKNTIFYKIYTNYTNLYCSEFLIKVKKDFDSSSHHLLTDLSSSILHCLKFIPTHFIIILSKIFQKITYIHDEIQANNAICALFFIHYLLPFFKSYSDISHLGIIEANEAVNYMITKTDKYQPTQFKNTVILLTQLFSYSPLMVVRECQFNVAEQERTKRNMLLVLKTELKEISNYYRGDFCSVFNCIKGSSLKEQSILYSTKEFIHWLEEREQLIRYENNNLTNKIIALKKRNERLKHQIIKIKKLI